MGFNPYRKRVARRSDIVFLVAALVIALACVLWVLAGVSDEVDDLWGALEVRKVQPYQAAKVYLCPGCHGDIPTGMGHLVVVPVTSPADRRHWHEPCFRNRHRRR